MSADDGAAPTPARGAGSPAAVFAAIPADGAASPAAVSAANPAAGDGFPRVRRVESSRDREAFVRLPYRLYAGDPLWVPQPLSSVRGEFDPASNPYLRHCDIELFLLERGPSAQAGGPARGAADAAARGAARGSAGAKAGATADAKADAARGAPRVVGRIAAMIDRLALEAWGAQIGMFAYFECAPDDAEGAALLLGAARDWLRARGMKAMRGPWSFVSQEWGLVVEGFSPRAVVMAPYNPPGYAALLEGFGLAKAKDLLAWEISMDEGYRIPDRILDLTDGVARRFGLSIRTIDFSRYAEEVETFARLSLDTLKDNWGISPITDAEVEALARELRPILRPECVLFARDPGGRDVGFALTLPDVNEIFHATRGRMLPFGWARLLWGLPRLKRFRMFGLGVDRIWRGKGVDALLYRAMWERMAKPGASMEINYVLEDNAPMVNAIEKLGARPSRRYRVYEMSI